MFIAVGKGEGHNGKIKKRIKELKEDIIVRSIGDVMLVEVRTFVTRKLYVNCN